MLLKKRALPPKKARLKKLPTARTLFLKSLPLLPPAMRKRGTKVEAKLSFLGSTLHVEY